MGGICCTLCFNKSFHGLDMADKISHDLKSMIRKISWGNNIFDTLPIKLNDDMKQLIAKIIVKHVKKNNIKVLNLNGFITDYISINIAGLIFHKFIWDVIYTSMMEELPVEQRLTFNYPTYNGINMEYKDIFTNRAIDNYIKKFTDNNYFERFTTEFRKKNNLTEYNVEYQLGKEVITKHLEKYIDSVINQIINDYNTNNTIDGPFNYSKFMNYMITKKTLYESQVENSYYKISP